jgi:hypothetical protein
MKPRVRKELRLENWLYYQIHKQSWPILTQILSWHFRQTTIQMLGFLDGDYSFCAFSRGFGDVVKLVNVAIAWHHVFSLHAKTSARYNVDQANIRSNFKQL